MRSALLLSLGLNLVAATSTPAGNKNDAQPSKDTYVKVRVEVEMRGVLNASDKTVTVAVRDRVYNLFSDAEEIRREGAPATVHTLDFVRTKDLRELAKALDGKEVIVTGMSELRMVVQPTPPGRVTSGGSPGPIPVPTWSLLRTVEVTGMKSAAGKADPAKAPPPPTHYVATRLMAEDKLAIVKAVHPDLKKAGFDVRTADDLVKAFDLSKAAEFAKALNPPSGGQIVDLTYDFPSHVLVTQGYVQFPGLNDQSPAYARLIYKTTGPGLYVVSFNVTVDEGRDPSTPVKFSAFVDGVRQDIPVRATAQNPVVAVAIDIPDANYHYLTLACEKYWSLYSVEVQALGGR
jgi:hypothetical protein